MDNQNNPNGFSYTYSAKEQAELKKLREKYTSTTQEEDKLTHLRRLDAGVTSSAQAVALVFGVLGTLILGFGMSLCMTEFSAILGAHEDLAMIIGIIIGLIGGVIAALAYPIYNAIIKAKRRKIAPEIIRLTDELLK